MNQEIKSHQTIDENGTPTGGTTTGLGIAIQWQEGPLVEGTTRREPNGACVDGVISAALERLEFYQAAAGGAFACAENAEAIAALREALEHLARRTERRETAGVAGTHMREAA